MIMPYHGKRSLKKPGLDWLTADGVGIPESFLQSVLDTNRLHDLLRKNFQYKNIYIVGLSIGGNVAAVSSFLRKYNGCSYITSGVSTSSLLFNAPLPFVKAVSKKIREEYSEEEIHKLWIMADTSKYKAKNKSNRHLVIAGVYDDFASPKLATNLMNSFPETQLLVYPGNHYNSILFLKDAFKNIHSFFKSGKIEDTGWKLPETN